MRYFDVYKKTIEGMHKDYIIDSGGAELYPNAPEYGDRTVEYLIGFEVVEYDEDGMTIDKKMYYVDRGSKGNDPDSVLEKIKEDHQPDMWQNNAW